MLFPLLTHLDGVCRCSSQRKPASTLSMRPMKRIRSRGVALWQSSHALMRQRTQPKSTSSRFLIPTVGRNGAPAFVQDRFLAVPGYNDTSDLARAEFGLLTTDQYLERLDSADNATTDFLGKFSLAGQDLGTWASPCTSWRTPPGALPGAAAESRSPLPAWTCSTSVSSRWLCLRRSPSRP